MPTPDTGGTAALAGLLDQLAQDQRALQALLDAHPGPMADLPERARSQALMLLQRRDTTEALMQAQWGEHPLPRPAATPSSARPFATPTPVP